jgi:hypothetical protein
MDGHIDKWMEHFENDFMREGERERERGTYIERDIESDMGVEGDRGRDSERERERFRWV